MPSLPGLCRSQPDRSARGSDLGRDASWSMGHLQTLRKLPCDSARLCNCGSAPQAALAVVNVAGKTARGSGVQGYSNSEQAVRRPAHRPSLLRKIHLLVTQRVWKRVWISWWKTLWITLGISTGRCHSACASTPDFRITDWASSQAEARQPWLMFHVKRRAGSTSYPDTPGTWRRRAAVERIWFTPGRFVLLVEASPRARGRPDGPIPSLNPAVRPCTLGAGRPAPIRARDGCCVEACGFTCG